MARTAKPATTVATEATDAEAGANRRATGLRLRVRALQAIRWRIGRQFGPEPVDIEIADLTSAENAALVADPLLSVDLIVPD